MSAVAETEMKAGHLPAERAGGRRIVSKKDRRQSETERTSSESSEEAGVVEKDSSLPAQMEKSYPTSAVRHSHDKPQPAHQAHYAHAPSHASGHVFQPRKNC
ncbi:unnamed protein product [Nippostrongylus brasiliensis]|uniref:Death-associated protein 1 n=1 Tax=Nippostrongylus brasiliensis TaxID=27835 RepID=A0A0N4XYL0_NIPBR|nr:hypothetical protein Q1695_009215 [Nippostrongylus brasiliensis]VDL71769.1 unnamed protein product [Nippostrongylus brasiliensis]